MNEFEIAFATQVDSGPAAIQELAELFRQHFGPGCVIDLFDLDIGQQLHPFVPPEEWVQQAIESPHWISGLDHGTAREVMFLAQDVVKRDIPGNWIPSSVNCKKRAAREVMIMHRDGQWVNIVHGERFHPYIEISFWGYGGPTIINTPSFPLPVVQRFVDIPPMKALWEDIRTRWDKPMIIASVA